MFLILVFKWFFMELGCGQLAIIYFFRGCNKFLWVTLNCCWKFRYAGSIIKEEPNGNLRQMMWKIISKKMKFLKKLQYFKIIKFSKFIMTNWRKISLIISNPFESPKTFIGFGWFTYILKYWFKLFNKNLFSKHKFIITHEKLINLK